MKKGILYITILLSISILSCACSKKDDKKVDGVNKEVADLDYKADNANGFCVDEVGNVYTLIQDQNKIQAFDVKGKLLKEYSIEKDSDSHLSVYDKSLYYISFDTLYELDLTSGKSKLLCKLGGDYFGFNCMTAYKDSIFFIRKNQNDDEQAEVRYDENDSYIYEGEKLICYDKVKKKIDTIDIPNIKLITKKNDTELLVYAYDGEGGFYFTTYNVVTGKRAEKTYTKMRIQFLNAITYDKVLDKVICEDDRGLFAIDITDAASQSYFYEKGHGLYDGNGIQYLNGYTYYIMDIDDMRRIKGIYNNSYIKDNPVLKCYTIGSNSNRYMPEGFGYQINCQELNENELANVLLAGDSDYDFAILSSQDQIAKNIYK